jgi:hypothetical protein
MFIVQLRNGNFALMQSRSNSYPVMICECESYDAAMEIKLSLED